MHSVLVAMIVSLVAQAPPPERSAKAEGGSYRETAHVRVTASSSAQAPGKGVSLFVDVAPKPAMHVYSPGQKGYIATTLTLDANPAFAAAKAKYPAGEKLFMKVLNETQLVYSKPFRITQDIRLRQTAAGVPITITGTLRYQACDDKICYLPQNVPVEWSLKPTPSK